MLRAPTDADLVRLRQFLHRLESDAKDAVEDAEFCGREIDRLKSEIAYLEAARSKSFLAQIGIDFGSQRTGKKAEPISAVNRAGRILAVEVSPHPASSIRKIPRTSPNSEA